MLKDWWLFIMKIDNQIKRCWKYQIMECYSRLETIVWWWFTWNDDDPSTMNKKWVRKWKKWLYHSYKICSSKINWGNIG